MSDVGMYICSLYPLYLYYTVYIGLGEWGGCVVCQQLAAAAATLTLTIHLTHDILPTHLTKTPNIFFYIHIFSSFNIDLSKKKKLLKAKFNITNFKFLFF